MVKYIMFYTVEGGYDMDQAEKEALEAQRREIMQRRAQFFIDNPELAAWTKTKKIIYWFLAGYLILHSVLSIVVMTMSGILTSRDLIMELVKCLFGMFWLFLFTNPSGTGNWRLHVMLYVSAAGNLMTVLNNSALVQDVLLTLPQMQIGYMLLYGGLIVMELLYPALLFIIATYLIAFRKHREWSEQVEAMYKSSIREMSGKP